MMFFNNKACPRCGKEYKYIEQRKCGDRIYFYAVHEEKLPGGKRRVKKCYLGPLVYEYVSKLHSDLNIVFKGLLETNRALDYLETLLNTVVQMELDQETRKRVAEKLRFYADLLEKT